MSLMLSLSMYFLSFIPLWITVLFIDIKSMSESDGNTYTEIISIIVIIVFTIISVIVFLFEFNGTKNGYIEDYVIREVYERKTITAEFLLSYILPLFAFDFSKWDQVVEFLIFFLTFGFLCVRHNYFSVNIVLEIKHYKIYECNVVTNDGVGVTKTIISKQTLTLAKGKKIPVKLLNNEFGLNIAEE